tara:strand:- start:1134 stop:1403 length:270 start_codon:yes stop_codon:yes gene_type:complete
MESVNETIKNKFLVKCKQAKKLTSLDDTNKLLLYAYYKQATIGNINIEKPSIFNLKDTAKWNAWNEQKNERKKDAMLNYIILVDVLTNK